MFGAVQLTHEVVRAATEGSREGVDETCAALHPQVRLMVAARLSPTPSQLDGVDAITQEVLVALATRISHLEQCTVNGLKGFLSGIVTRKVATFDQLTTRDIAKLMGITREAAYMRFRRAVDKLRAGLASPEHGRGIDDNSR